MKGPGLTLAAVIMAYSLPATAIDLMTGDGYLLSLGQGEQARLAAQSYLDGTFDNLLVINEIIRSDGTPMFCITEAQSADLDKDSLKAEFVEWLKKPVDGDSADADQPGAMPVSVLAWGFLGKKFACNDGDDVASNADIRKLLMDSMNK